MQFALNSTYFYYLDTCNCLTDIRVKLYKKYGLVFGIANLAAFLFAPLFGKYGTNIGVGFLYKSGAFLQALCGLAFGFLVYCDNTAIFLALSYILR